MTRKTRVRSALLHVRLTPAEKAFASLAAEQAGESVSALARAALAHAARHIMEGGRLATPSGDMRLEG